MDVSVASVDRLWSPRRAGRGGRACPASMSRAAAARRDVVDRRHRLAPHLLVVPVEQRDGPVAAAHEPIRDRKRRLPPSTAGRRSDAAQSPGGEHRVQPGDLRAHVRERGGSGRLAGPLAHLRRSRAAACRGGRSRSSAPESSRELGHDPRDGAGRRREARASSPLFHDGEALSTPACSIQCGSGSSWIRWRNASQLRLGPASTPSRASAVTGERRSSHAVTAPIQSCSAACSNIASVSLSVHADWTRIVRSTPHASSRGRRSAGSKSRAITACSGVIHGIGSRPRFQKCWWVSIVIRARFLGEDGEPPASVADAGGCVIRRMMTAASGLAELATLAFVTSAVPVSTFFATALKPVTIAGCPRAGLYLLRLGHGVHQSSPTERATSTHAGPSGNAYSSSDSGSISML